MPTVRAQYSRCQRRLQRAFEGRTTLAATWFPHTRAVRAEAPYHAAPGADAYETRPQGVALGGRHTAMKLRLGLA